MKTLTIAVSLLALSCIAFAACQSDEAPPSSNPQGPGPVGVGGSGTGGSTGGTGTAAMGAGAGPTGMGGTSTTTGGMSTGGSAGTSAGGTAGSGGICSEEAKLYPPKGASGEGGAPPHGIYCPFSSGGAGGKNKYCKGTVEKCCQGFKKGDVSTCELLSTPCPQGWDAIECTDNIDCTGGKKCCGIGMFMLGTGTHPETGKPCGNYVSKFGGTQCKDSCDAPLVQICTDDSQCKPNEKCLAYNAAGGDYGACTPK